MQIGGAQMTQTEMIKCPICGQARPINVRTPSLRERARNRPCNRCGNIQANANRHPPDVDELAVRFLVDGAKINVTPAERTAAVAILTARKLSASAIAARIHCTQRTVERHRAKLNAA